MSVLTSSVMSTSTSTRSVPGRLPASAYAPFGHPIDLPPTWQAPLFTHHQTYRARERSHSVTSSVDSPPPPYTDDGHDYDRFAPYIDDRDGEGVYTDDDGVMYYQDDNGEIYWEDDPDFYEVASAYLRRMPGFGQPEVAAPHAAPAPTAQAIPAPAAQAPPAPPAAPAALLPQFTSLEEALTGVRPNVLALAAGAVSSLPPANAPSGSRAPAGPPTRFLLPVNPTADQTPTTANLDYRGALGGAAGIAQPPNPCELFARLAALSVSDSGSVTSGVDTPPGRAGPSHTVVQSDGNAFAWSFPDPVQHGAPILRVRDPIPGTSHDIYAGDNNDDEFNRLAVSIFTHMNSRRSSYSSAAPDAAGSERKTKDTMDWVESLIQADEGVKDKLDGGARMLEALGPLSDRCEWWYDFTRIPYAGMDPTTKPKAETASQDGPIRTTAIVAPEPRRVSQIQVSPERLNESVSRDVPAPSFLQAPEHVHRPTPPPLPQRPTGQLPRSLSSPYLRLLPTHSLSQRGPLAPPVPTRPARADLDRGAYALHARASTAGSTVDTAHSRQTYTSTGSWAELGANNTTQHDYRHARYPLDPVQPVYHLPAAARQTEITRFRTHPPQASQQAATQTAWPRPAPLSTVPAQVPPQTMVRENTQAPWSRPNQVPFSVTATRSLEVPPVRAYPVAREPVQIYGPTSMSQPGPRDIPSSTEPFRPNTAAAIQPAINMGLPHPAAPAPIAHAPHMMPQRQMAPAPPRSAPAPTAPPVKPVEGLPQSCHDLPPAPRPLPPKQRPSQPAPAPAMPQSYSAPVAPPSAPIHSQIITDSRGRKWDWTIPQGPPPPIITPFHYPQTSSLAAPSYSVNKPLPAPPAPAPPFCKGIPAYAYTHEIHLAGDGRWPTLDTGHATKVSRPKSSKFGRRLSKFIKRNLCARQSCTA